MGQQSITGRVLVTGATGFIGGALVRRLLAQGAGVDVLTRDRNKARDHFGGRVRAVQNLDELDQDASKAPPSIVVNLAGKNLGEQRWNDRVKRELVESRTATTRHVVDYLSRSGLRPSVLISGSAVGYYGARGDEPLDENAAPGDEFQSRLCEEWESVARRAEDHGVRVCLSRTGVVIGQGGGVLSGLAPLFRKGLGAIVGSGRQWVSWIALDDLIELFVDFMLDPDLSGPFNNTSPELVTHRTFSRTLGKVVHRPVLLRVPGPALRIAVGELAHLQVTGQRAIPRRNIERGFTYRHPDLQSAMEVALGSDGRDRHYRATHGGSRIA